MGNAYFGFIVPAILVFYIIAIFLSVKGKNVKIGIISSILFFVCLKFVFSLKWTNGISKTTYSYLYHRSVDSALCSGHINFEEVSKIFPSFAEHPPIIIVLSMIELVTGLKFDLIYSFLMLLVAPLIMIPIIYIFLRSILGLTKSEALLGLLLYNSNFMNFGFFPFGYAQYGFLLFLLTLYFLGEKDISSRAIFFILCFVNSMTYSISSYSLIFFVLILYILQRLGFLTNAAKLDSLDVSFPIITTLTWTTHRAISDLITIKTVAELFLGHLSPIPEFTYAATSQVISDPYAYLIYFVYVGQGLVLLLGFFGLVTTLFCFRNKKNFMYILLWLPAVVVLVFFAFGVSWLHLSPTIMDYRFRLVMYLMLLIVPLTVFGFQKLESTLSKISNKKTSFALIGIVTFLIVFSPIGDSASTILRRNPIAANELTAAPYQWIKLSQHVSSYAPEDINLLGGGLASFSWSMGVIPQNRLVINLNPYLVINKSKGPYFLAFSRHNLYLPEDSWGNEKILTNKQFESINLRCNKYFDSGDVWLYYFESTK